MRIRDFCLGEARDDLIVLVHLVRLELRDTLFAEIRRHHFMDDLLVRDVLLQLVDQDVQRRNLRLFPARRLEGLALAPFPLHLGLRLALRRDGRVGEI